MKNNENKKEGMYLLKDCLRSSSLSWTDGTPQERPRIGKNLDLCNCYGQDASTSTWLGPRVQIGNNVGLEPNLVIEADAVIGDGVQIPRNSTIGARTEIAAVTKFRIGAVTIGADNEIGHSCEIVGSLTTGNDCKIGNRTTLRHTKSLDDNVEIGNDCSVGGRTLADRVKLHDHVVISFLTSKINTGSTLCEHVKCYARKIGKNVLIGAYANLDIGVEIEDNLEILPNAQIPEGVHITATEVIEHYRRDEDGNLKRLKYLLIYPIYERESDIPQNDRLFSAWRKRTPLKEHPLGQYVRLRKPLEEQANVPNPASESALIRVWRILNQVFK